MEGAMNAAVPDCSRLRGIGTRLILPTLMVGWLGLSALVFWWLQAYATTPGQPARPVNGPLPLATDKGERGWRLILFVHPHCPCSIPLLAELVRLTERLPGLQVRMVFVRPPGCPEGWEAGRLFQRASALPQVQAVIDADGVEARRFGARTSGQAFLFDREDRLCFQGGLTVSRGHEGASPGGEAVIALVANGTADRSQTPVFGCPLFDEDGP
jgi:hypothetical protein